MTLWRLRALLTPTPKRSSNRNALYWFVYMD